MVRNEGGTIATPDQTEAELPSVISNECIGRSANETLSKTADALWKNPLPRPYQDGLSDVVFHSFAEPDCVGISRKIAFHLPQVGPAGFLNLVVVQIYHHWVSDFYLGLIDASISFTEGQNLPKPLEMASEMLRLKKPYDMCRWACMRYILLSCIGFWCQSFYQFLPFPDYNSPQGTGCVLATSNFYVASLVGA